MLFVEIRTVIWSDIEQANLARVNPAMVSRFAAYLMIAHPIC